MAQATFSVSFGAIHLDREQLSQFREGVHHNGYITGHLALVKMQDTGAGTADKFKIMGDNENDLSQLRQPPDQPRHLGHAVKVQTAGRLVKHQQVFSADHADRYGHPLLLPTGQRVGGALPIGSQPQFLQS